MGALAVVKANGYGHGALPSRAPRRGRCRRTRVSQVAEALALREGGITAPVTAWLHVPDTDSEAAIAGGVDIAVSSPRQLDAVVDAAARRGEPATLTVKVDTGMNRSGVGWAEWEVFIEAFARAHAAGAVALRGVMAHLVQRRT